MDRSSILRGSTNHFGGFSLLPQVESPSFHFITFCKFVYLWQILADTQRMRDVDGRFQQMELKYLNHRACPKKQMIEIMRKKLSIILIILSIILILGKVGGVMRLRFDQDGATRRSRLRAAFVFWEGLWTSLSKHTTN